MVADDEDVVRMAFEKAFAEQDEFVLDTARTVKETLEKLAQVQYDIIFLDMKIEHSWSGMQVLREINRLEIRARGRGQPVLESLIIIMSGSIPFDEFMAEAHELGVLCFLDKPVQFDVPFIKRAMNRLGVPLLPRQTEPLARKLEALTPPPDKGTLPP